MVFTSTVSVELASVGLVVFATVIVIVIVGHLYKERSFVYLGRRE